MINVKLGLINELNFSIYHFLFLFQFFAIALLHNYLLDYH